MKDIFLKLMLNAQKNYMKERKLKEYKSLLLIYMMKINMLFT